MISMAFELQFQQGLPMRNDPEVFYPKRFDPIVVDHVLTNDPRMGTRASGRGRKVQKEGRSSTGSAAIAIRFNCSRTATTYFEPGGAFFGTSGSAAACAS